VFNRLKKGVLGEQGTKAVIILLLILGVVTSYYFWHEFDFLIYDRSGSPNAIDKTFGVIALILGLITLYSYAGPILLSVAVLLILYCIFGPYFPGFMKFPGFSLMRIVTFTVTEIQRGLFGNLLQMGATIVAVFVLLAGFVEGLGSFDVIFKFSLLLVKKSKYLITQTAILASAIMGMFSGSGAGNVAGTGSFTIPLMKKYNVPGYFAGAVEAVASAGGQIMPPIMGAAIFLMAEYLGVPYIKLAYMGIVPALLYFIGVGFSTHFITTGLDIKIPDDMQQTEEQMGEAQKIKNLFIDAIPLVVTLFVLIYLMAVVQFDALIAGYFSSLFFIALVFVWNLIKSLSRKESITSYVCRFVKMLVNGMKSSAGTIMEIALMLGMIEVFVVILSTSGVALKMNMLILSMAREQAVLILLLSAVICIILGCVVSTVAVYILAMVTVVPALLRIGIDPFVAHFYVFWYAIAGLITPPVAGNVIAACRIAKSDFWKTAVTAMKIGVPIFIVPVALITHPEILHYNAQTPVTFIVFLVALYSIANGFFGNYSYPQGAGVVSLIKVITGLLAFATFFIPNNTIILIIGAVLVLTNIFFFRRSRSTSNNNAV